MMHSISIYNHGLIPVLVMGKMKPMKQIKKTKHMEKRYVLGDLKVCNFKHTLVISWKKKKKKKNVFLG